MDVEDTVDTILGVFQRPDRCSPLNEPLPRGGPTQDKGLQRLVRWGVKLVATLGEHIVFPFSRGNVATTAIRSLGRDPFSWKFVAEHMTVGIFHVDSVGYTNHQVSFVKRLVGPTQVFGGGVDPITQLKAVAVNLDYQYGLLLTEHAIEHARDSDAASDLQCRPVSRQVAGVTCSSPGGGPEAWTCGVGGYEGGRG